MFKKPVIDLAKMHFHEFKTLFALFEREFTVSQINITERKVTQRGKPFQLSSPNPTKSCSGKLHTRHPFTLKHGESGSVVKRNASASFFDQGDHDVLMARVSRKVHDKRLLKLIGRYLRAGVMIDGLCQPSEQGTMQGGPLSPLLSNIYLDDLDKELERRGLPFVRYADDFVIFTKTEVAAQRVYASIERFLTTRLKLIVNTDKSSVQKTQELEYGGRIIEYNVIAKGGVRMVQIVATDELAKQLENMEGIVELIDANGNWLSVLTRPPSDEDVRIANERRAAYKPGMTTEELVNTSTPSSWSELVSSHLGR